MVLSVLRTTFMGGGGVNPYTVFLLDYLSVCKISAASTSCKSYSVVWKTISDNFVVPITSKWWWITNQIKLPSINSFSLIKFNYFGIINEDFTTI